MSHDADALIKMLSDADPEWAGLLRHRVSAGPPGDHCEAFSSQPPEPGGPKPGEWKETLDELWDHVSQNAYGENMPPPPREGPEPAMVRPENLRNTFEHDSDVLPRGSSMRIDRKMVHSAGSVARFKFTPIQTPIVQGLFSSECHGLLRVSNGNSEPNKAFAAGLALKFPRTDMSSADMLFGGAFLGETSSEKQGRSFFEAPLRSWLDPIPNKKKLRNIRTLFWMFNRMREQSGCPAFSGLALNVDELFRFDQDGHPSTASSPAAGLVLKATPETRTKYSSSFDTDKKASDSALPAKKYRDFRNAFQRLLSGQLELTVQMRAKKKNRADPNQLITLGRLTSTSDFISSPFGDQKLYFRHAADCPHPRVLPG